MIAEMTRTICTDNKNPTSPVWYYKGWVLLCTLSVLWMCVCYNANLPVSPHAKVCMSLCHQPVPPRSNAYVSPRRPTRVHMPTCVCHFATYLCLHTPMFSPRRGPLYNQTLGATLSGSPSGGGLTCVCSWLEQTTEGAACPRHGQHKSVNTITDGLKNGLYVRMYIINKLQRNS